MTLNIPQVSFNIKKGILLFSVMDYQKCYLQCESLHKLNFIQLYVENKGCLESLAGNQFNHRGKKEMLQL